MSQMMLDDYGFDPDGLVFNNAADNNKAPIYQVLQQVLTANESIFEIGSGTAQHAVYCCKRQPDWQWQPSDMADKLAVANSWVTAAGLNNINTPFEFVVKPNIEQSLAEISACFTANTLHIMQRETSQQLIEWLAQALPIASQFFAYGPFKVDGQFTTQSNAEFNQWLLNEGYGGIIDIADISLWSNNQLKLIKVHVMPANNFLLQWRRE